MTICKQCGERVEVVRVIMVEATTWREVRCQGPGRHTTVTREEIGSEAEYRRIRAAYLRAHRTNDDTGIIKVRSAS